MIRLSSSLFISITIHTVLILALIFVWNNYSSTAEVKCDKKLHLKLCDVVVVKEVNEHKNIEKPNPQPNKEIKKVKKQEIKAEKKIDKIVEETKKDDAVIYVEKKLEQVKPQEPKKIEQEYIEETPQELAVVNTTVEKQEVIEEKTEKREEKTHEYKQQILVDEYLHINTQKIAKLLQENLYYPRSARKRNITGDIIVKFTLGCDAVVSDVEVLESKSDILSRAAIKTIKNLSGKFPKPQNEVILQVPINYSLQ